MCWQRFREFRSPRQEHQLLFLQGVVSHFDELANMLSVENRTTKGTAQALRDELLFERATQAYLWALPATAKESNIGLGGTPRTEESSAAIKKRSATVNRFNEVMTPAHFVCSKETFRVLGEFSLNVRQVAGKTINGRLEGYSNEAIGR